MEEATEHITTNVVQEAVRKSWLGQISSEADGDTTTKKRWL